MSIWLAKAFPSGSKRLVDRTNPILEILRIVRIRAARRGLSRVPAMFGIAAVSLPMSGFSATAQNGDFYAGKVITLVVSSGAGGEYDRNLRLLQRHISKYIPGRPSVVVINQVGAGGLVAVNHASKVAPKDGTWLVLVMNGVLLFEGIGKPGIQTTLNDFKWIGNFSQASAVTVVTKSSGIRSLSDARAKEVTIGSSGAGSLSAMLPTAYNALVGTRFKMVRGYEGAAAMNLAMRKGEIEGRSGGTWPSYIADFPEISDGFLVPLSQVGEKPDPKLPDVPLLNDLVLGDSKKLAASRFISRALTQNRSLAGPPGMPDDRVAMLREAFTKTMADPEFLAEAERAKMELSPSTGEEVANTVRQVLQAPADVRTFAKAVLTNESN